MQQMGKKGLLRLARRTNKPLVAPKVWALANYGYTVRDMNPRYPNSQLRVDEAVDFYPGGRRYHVLATNQRGDMTDDLLRLIQNILPMR